MNPRPLGYEQPRAIPRGLAADQANAQRRRACLVFFDESALSLTPNVRRTWAPKGRPPTLTHPFNWRKASMAAAICYGIRGGGARLCFHVRAGNYDTDSLIEGLWSSLKAVELANLVSSTLGEVIDQAHQGIDRVRRTPHLAYSFLRHTGLSVA